MTAIVQCPACDTQLDLKTDERIGKRVRCPRCKEVFTAELASPRRKRSSSGGAPEPRRRTRSAEPPRRDARSAPPPRRTNAKKKKSGKKNKGAFPVLPVLAGVGGLMAIVAVAAILLSGGNDGVDTTSGGASGGAGSDAGPAKAIAQAAKDAPVSEEQVLRFVSQMEEAVKNSDPASFNQLLNYGFVIDNAIADVSVPDRIKQSFKAGVLSGGSQLSSQIIQQAQGDGSYRFLNQRVGEDGQRQVLFRLLADSGVNYHRFDLINQSGQTVVGDMYVAASGEYISTTLRRLFIPLAQSANRTLLDRLMGKDQLIVKHWATIEKLQQAFQAGQYQSGMGHYRALPSELQKENFVLLLRIQCAAAQNSLGDDYAAALADFRKAQPNSVATSLMSIDYFLIKQQYSDSMKAIDKVDEFTQGDPYLNIMRGNLWMVSGDLDKAADCFRPVLKHESLGKAATTPYLDVVIGQKDHKETLDTLLRLEREYGLQFPRSMAGVEGFGDFARSPEHEQFRRR